MARLVLPLRMGLMSRMLGEFSGKILSTPSLLTILRTVKFSFMPRPFLLITVPVKICIRSLSPSFILHRMSTMSPISKWGIFSFKDFASTASKISVFTVGLLFRWFLSKKPCFFSFYPGRSRISGSKELLIVVILGV